MKSAPAFDLRQLHYFLAAAEHGSIAAAATALGIAPATLSEGLAVLETRLGLRLAERNRRGLALTPAGQAVLREGMALLEAADALVQAAQVAASRISGPVALALPPSLGALIGVPLAETVRSDLPDVKLRISDGLSGDILDWVAAGSVDLGFVYETPDPSIYQSRAVFQEELFLLAAPDFVPADATAGPLPEIAPEILGRLPLVMPSSRHNLRNLIDGLARAREIELRIESEIDSYTQILDMVGRASAYTIISRSAVLAQLAREEFVLVRIAGGLCRRTCHVVRSRRSPTTPASRAVEEALVEIIREMNRRFSLDLIIAPEDDR